MLARIRIIAGAIVVILVIALLSGAAYTVTPTQQVIITQFGQPIGDPITLFHSYGGRNRVSRYGYIAGLSGTTNMVDVVFLYLVPPRMLCISCMFSLPKTSR